MGKRPGFQERLEMSISITEIKSINNFFHNWAKRGRKAAARARILGGDGQISGAFLLSKTAYDKPKHN